MGTADAYDPWSSDGARRRTVRATTVAFTKLRRASFGFARLVHIYPAEA